MQRQFQPRGIWRSLGFLTRARYTHPNTREDGQTQVAQGMAPIFVPCTVSRETGCVKGFQGGGSRNHCKKPKGLRIDLSAHFLKLSSPSHHIILPSSC